MALGACLGPSLIGLMLSRQVPWQAIFYIISGFYLVFLVLWSLMPVEFLHLQTNLTFIIFLCPGVGLTVAAAAIMPVAVISVFFFALTGLFCSGVFPMVMAFGTSTYPAWISEISGFFAAVAGVGAMVVPSAAGAVADWTGLRRGFFVLSLLMLIATGLAAAVGHCRYCANLGHKR